MRSEDFFPIRTGAATVRRALFTILPFLLALALFAWLGRYAFPIADDHLYGLAYRELGLWRLITNTYLEWSGRYIANSIVGLLGARSGNVALYHWYPLFLLVLLTASLRFLAGSCHKGSSLDAWGIALCLSVTFLAGMPSPGQGLYWMCGAITYFLAFPAIFVVLGCLCRYAYFPEHPGKGTAVICVAALCVSMGCNEVSAAASLFLLACACVVAFFRRHERRRSFAAFTVWGFFFFLLAFGAPGNFARAEVIGNVWQWKFLLHIGGGAFEGYKWLARTAFVPAILFCALLFSPRRLPGGARFSPQKRLLLLFLLGGLLFLGEFLLVYVSSKRPPYARINNAIYHSAFLWGLIAAGAMQGEIRGLLNRLAGKFGPRKVAALVGALLCLSILGQPSIRAVLHNSYTGGFTTYRQVWLQRLALLPPREEAIGVTLELPPLRSRPAPVFFRDLEENQEKHQWIAEVFARYYGLEKVVIAPPGPPEK